MSRWEFFDPETDTKLACSHCGVMLMDDDFMRLLDDIRADADFPFHITSGYRCPHYNAEVSSTGFHGPHTTGRAVDISIHNGAMRLKLVRIAMKFGIERIGIAKTFVHLDNLTPLDGFTPSIWTY